MIVEREARHAQRLEPRMKVLLAAELVTPFGTIPCRMHDISRGGACLDGDVALPVGLALRFRREGLDVAATIAWSRGKRVGIKFDAPIRATDLLVQMSRSRRDPAAPRLSVAAASGRSPSR